MINIRGGHIPVAIGGGHSAPGQQWRPQQHGHLRLAEQRRDGRIRPAVRVPVATAPFSSEAWRSCHPVTGDLRPDTGLGPHNRGV